MNLAIVHYHLNRGGVARVIENQLAALDTCLDPARPWRVAVLYGGRREGFCEDLAERLRAIRLSLHELPRLDYDGVQPSGEPGGGDESAERLYREIADVLRDLDFQAQHTVLHVHNPSLGKNRHLPAALGRLGESGYGLVLQIHDFAEDFRPANYARIGPEAASTIYPQGPAIHYCVLNGRDRDILLDAGVARRRLHLLPNPVPDPGALPPKADARDKLDRRFGVRPADRLVLYPVRCIRRKNLGEALLYAALAPPGHVVGLTLPPLNPTEVPIYEYWKQLAAELDLPCRFELGVPGGLTFAENRAAADLILTTSVAEGFGMVFLESWLAGLPLMGRDLPEITADFRDGDLRLDGLRPEIRVPVDWIGAERFRKALDGAYRATLAAYGKTPPNDLKRRIETKIVAGRVDFGDLDERMQEAVVRIVRGDRASHRRVYEENPGLAEALAADADRAAGTIRHNAEVIRRHFSSAPSGRRLLDLYRQVAADRGGRRIETLPHGERILDRFLDFARFHLIRT